MQTEVIILVVLVILSAFFSGVEAALISLSSVKVNSLVAQKRRGSGALSRIKANPHRMIITILIGNNLVNVAAASIATVLATELFGNSGVGIATGLMTLVILVFGEITPKTLAIQRAATLGLLVARPIEILSFILTPVINFLEKITQVVSSITGVSEHKELTEGEMQTMVAMGVREGILTKNVAKMMHNILEFSDKKATEIMTPEPKMAMVDANSKLADILPFIIRSPYSVYPAYSETRNNVVGFLHTDDILNYIYKKRLDVKVSKVTRPAYFVPETKGIEDLLKELSPKKTPMAVILDEYGSIVGLVTLEDVLEEIVGNIFDKSLRASAYVHSVDENTIKADAQVSIEVIENMLHVGLKSDHFLTMAGLIEEKLGRIPKVGDELRMKNLRIIVEEADGRSIKRVKIIREKTAVGNPA